MVALLLHACSLQLTLSQVWIDGKPVVVDKALVPPPPPTPPALHARMSGVCGLVSAGLQVRCSAKELLEKGEFWNAKVREALAKGN